MEIKTSKEIIRKFYPHWTTLDFNNGLDYTDKWVRVDDVINFIKINWDNGIAISPLELEAELSQSSDREITVSDCTLAESETIVQRSLKQSTISQDICKDEIGLEPLEFKESEKSLQDLSFEEQFPSLWSNIDEFMHHYDFVEERAQMFDMLQKYCLDKQQVKNELLKSLEYHEQQADLCCGLNNLTLMHYHFSIIEFIKHELKERLGLED
jgi:hypothetical protein